MSRSRLVVMVLVTALAFGGCSAQSPSAPPTAPGSVAPSSPEGSPSGETLTVALATFLKETLDPSQEGTTGHIYYGHMYDWFIGSTPEGENTNEVGVLESWEPGASERLTKAGEGVEEARRAEARAARLDETARRLRGASQELDSGAKSPGEQAESLRSAAESAQSTAARAALYAPRERGVNVSMQ